MLAPASFARPKQLQTGSAAVYNSGLQSIGTTKTKVGFDTVLKDSRGEFDTSTSTFNVATDGTYEVNFTSAWNVAVGADVLSYAEIQVNGTQKARRQHFGTGNGSDVVTVRRTLPNLSAGDNVTIHIYQDSSSSKQLNSGESLCYASFEQVNQVEP